MKDQIKVGQRVFCINAQPIPGFTIAGISKGEYYKVHEIINCKSCGKKHYILGDVYVSPRDSKICICGESIHPKAFSANRFRPLKNKIIQLNSNIRACKNY